MANKKLKWKKALPFIVGIGLLSGIAIGVPVSLHYQANNHKLLIKKEIDQIIQNVYENDYQNQLPSECKEVVATKIEDTFASNKHINFKLANIVPDNSMGTLLVQYGYSCEGYSESNIESLMNGFKKE